MAKVVGVEKNSVGHELGIEVGDELLGFDGRPFVDILDYLYYDEQENFVVNMRAKQGDIVDLEIEKYEDEHLGLILDEQSTELTPRRCKNKCMFCFVDQLPCGMRDTLYVKDDDYRFSFISGNYVTLTNTTSEDLDRIARLHLSPLYISVHCFDKATKTKMISNLHGAELFDKMRFLADNNICMHGQIVLCKGVNDGDKLEETLCELYKLYPHVLSVAIIPVGLTKFRDNLAPLEAIDKDTAIATIQLVENFDKHVVGGFCYCSDEFYIKADKDLPNFESYGDFGQIENGVGLCAEFENEFNNALSASHGSKKQGEIALVTGQSFKQILTRLTDKAKVIFPNLQIRIVDIYNDWFGRSITVAGLITASDIQKQAKDLPSNTVVPSNMLREFTDTFLDGVTVVELEKKLNTKIHISHNGGDVIKIFEGVLK